MAAEAEAGWADRYSRQKRFAPIGLSGQERLGGACVLIVGCGALGASLAQHMARAGVGTVRIADRDIVEPSNLQRQMLFDEADATESLPKAIAAANRLRRINGSVAIEPHVVDVTPETAAKLAAGADLVLDGTDNAATRLALSDVCFGLGIPFLYGGVAGSQGMSAVLVPGDTACLRCLIGGDGIGEAADSCDTVGVIAPIVETVAALQAAEALKWLTGNRNALRRSWLTIDLWPFRTAESGVPGPSAGCPCCGSAKRAATRAEAVRKLADLSNESPARGGESEAGPTSGRSPETCEFGGGSSDAADRPPAAALCGRNTVQVTLGYPLDLRRLQANSALLGWSDGSNPYLVRAALPEGIRLAMFPDGRVLVQGTQDSGQAVELCARYMPLLTDKRNERSEER